MTGSLGVQQQRDAEFVSEACALHIHLKRVARLLGPLHNVLGRGGGEKIKSCKMKSGAKVVDFHQDYITFAKVVQNG